MPTKIHIVKAMIFPVVKYGCKRWTIKKADHWRIDTFQLWCWRRLLRVPWTARRESQLILKEINPEYSLEGLMLKLKLQYFGHLMRRADSLGKNSDAGKDCGQEEKGVTEDEMVGWHHWLNGRETEQTLGDGEAGRAAVYGVAKCRHHLDWTTTKFKQYFCPRMCTCNHCVFICTLREYLQKFSVESLNSFDRILHVQGHCHATKPVISMISSDPSC